MIYQYAAAAKSLQSCLILCDPIDGSPSGSAIPGILQARTLEWVAIIVEYYSVIKNEMSHPSHKKKRERERERETWRVP